VEQGLEEQTGGRQLKRPRRRRNGGGEGLGTVGEGTEEEWVTGQASGAEEVQPVSLKRGRGCERGRRDTRELLHHGTEIGGVRC